jgi:hypothetical protein
VRVSVSMSAPVGPDIAERAAGRMAGAGRGTRKPAARPFRPTDGSGLHEGEQVGVNDVGMRRTHAVR